MISIKDFKVGETAYILRTYKREDKLCPAEVVAIGRKYVTVKEHGWVIKFSEFPNGDYALIGEGFLLFLSEQGYKDYTEKLDLESWLRNNVERYGRTRYSLEQLRKVKEILEGKNEG